MKPNTVGNAWGRMKNDNAEIGSKILQITTDYYLNSGDFNGISAQELSDEIGAEWTDLAEPLTKLISDDLIGLLYSDVEINTHVFRVRFEEKGNQIKKLSTQDLYHTCIYPLRKHLEQVVNRSNYQGRPYLLELALGSPQLAFRSFNLTILEQYRNDPRYHYSNDDVRGTISATDESLADKDQIVLEHFGFSYDEELNRAVAVFVCDLAYLSLEHQQIWKAKELTGNYQLHPDFYRNAILGEWGERISIFDAFLHEMWVINKMAEAMGRQPLFRRDYGEYGEKKPKGFGFLIRPTLEEFNAFVLLLDKMLSDNIDKGFFRSDIATEKEEIRADGKVVVTPIGSIQLLDSWARKSIIVDDWEPWNSSITALKKVRKLRQKPAHAVNENVFDQTYFKHQRELILQTYEAIRMIRLLLANHPSVKRAGIKASDVVQEGLIWTY